jgi:ribonuclease P protein component
VFVSCRKAWRRSLSPILKPRSESTPPASESPTRASESLPRALILRSRPRFDEIFARGERLTTKHFTLLISLPQPGSQARVAFLTPKKIGDAAHRNRVRRRMRETYRRHWPSNSSDHLRDLVFLAKSSTVRLDFAELRANLLDLHVKLTKKLGLA